jgi:hypothetical protein
VIVIDGEEFVYAERRREIQWQMDPQTGELVPFSVSTTTYPLADDGRSFGKTNLVSCSCGCNVRTDSALICRLCRSYVCRKHAIFAGKRTYCRNGICRLVGRVNQIFWVLYRIIRFCVCCVLGIPRGGGDDESRENQVICPPDEDRE